MTNPNPVNMAASVRQRLKNIADGSGRPFAEVLQWYVIELSVPGFRIRLLQESKTCHSKRA